MSPETYIETLLSKFRPMESYPFEDWVDNPISFYNLINLWDAIFRTAAGKHTDEYAAFGDARDEGSSFVYRVKHKNRNVVIEITPPWPSLETRVGGDFAIFETLYSPDDMEYFGYSEDKIEFGVNCDLDRKRLVCAFEMIRHFTHNLPENPDQGKRMYALFQERYGAFFGFAHYNPYNSLLFPITEADGEADD